MAENLSNTRFVKIPGAWRPGYFHFCLFLLLTFSSGLFAQKQTKIFEGIEIGFEMEQARGDRAGGKFMEGDHVYFRFTIRDTLTGEASPGQSRAWMNPPKRFQR